MTCTPEEAFRFRAVTHGELHIVIAHPFLHQAQSLSDMLQDAGYRHIRLISHDMLSLDTLALAPCDILLLDWASDHPALMTLCHMLSEHPALCHTIVLACCHSAHLGIRRAILGCGVSDILMEPINRHELTMRIEMHWQRRQMLASLHRYRERTRQEMDVAKLMHRDLLPSDSQVAQFGRQHGVHIGHCTQPASEIGGDLWGLHTTPSGKLGIYLVDFTGHGVSAAINSFRLHMLLHTLHIHSDVPATYATHINRLLCTMLPIWQFATFFYGVWDHLSHTLHYTAAACPSPLLLTGKTQHCTSLSSEGLPLGIRTESVYETHTIPLNPGDHLLLYSDALIESGNAQNISARLESAWTDAANIFPPNMKRLLSGLGFESLQDAKDDLTILTLSPSGVAI